MGRPALRHADLLRNLTSDELSTDSLGTRLSALLKTFDHLLDRSTLLLRLLLLLLIGLLQLLLARNDLLAVETDILRDAPQHGTAPGDAHDLLIHRIGGVLQELDLTLPLGFTLHRNRDTLNRDVLLAVQYPGRIGQQDQIRQLLQRNLEHVAIDVGGDR